MRHEVKIVKFNRKDFLNANNHIIEIDEWIAIEENDLLHHTSVKSVPDVHVTGTLEFDGMNFVSSDLSMDGTMVVLDSITNEDIDVHMGAGCWSSWHDEWMQVGTTHHDAVYQTVHHEATYQTVHHEAETTIVHHDATGHNEQVVDQAAWDETVITGYTCSGCGAVK